MAGVEILIDRSRIVIVAGPGGVGKTTVAAALGLLAADLAGKKVLVITVDPAKRLADSLGLVGLTSKGSQVSPTELDKAVGHKVEGRLFVAMLDAKSSWDELVNRHAPDAATRRKILSNPIYKNISSRFVQSHDYIAMETLYELYRSGEYDLIVVDTPPSRHAIDFLDAPSKMADFFSSKLLRWLTMPARNRLLMGMFKPFYQVADKILGAQFLSDVAEFFLLFESMYSGFVDRAKSVAGILENSETSFVVVASPESVPMTEAEFFISALDARHLRLGQMVVNRALPGYFRDPAAILLANKVQDDYETVAKELLQKGASLDLIKKSEFSPARLEALAERVLLEVADSFLNFSGVAVEQADEISKLPIDEELITLVPHLNFDVSDLNSLGKIAAYLATGTETPTM
jgi:anion-transporting  ArsA/GET3 family ATPase